MSFFTGLTSFTRPYFREWWPKTHYFSSVFIVLLLVGCTEISPADSSPDAPVAKSDCAFFDYEQSICVGAPIIQQPRQYGDTEYQKVRTRTGMHPAHIAEKISSIKATMAAAVTVDSSAAIQVVGTPIWDRARIQEIPEGFSESTVLVPLAVPGVRGITGVLFLQAFGGVYEDHLVMSREELLRPYLTGADQYSNTEFLLMVTAAGFDHYLYDYAYLPVAYGEYPDPLDGGVWTVDKNNISSGDPDTWILVEGCYRTVVEDDTGELG